MVIHFLGVHQKSESKSDAQPVTQIEPVTINDLGQIYKEENNFYDVWLENDLHLDLMSNKNKQKKRKCHGESPFSKNETRV